jgi:phosphatidylserine/phosphatidylglycerophosphate/cardiolipin synthase-like enzyme
MMRNIQRGQSDMIRACIIALIAMTFPAWCVEVAAPVIGVRIYFTPGDDAQSVAVAEIEKARSSILVQTYSFTSVPIAKALAEAYARGVKVQIITDRENETAKYTALDFLAGKGLEIFVDDKVRIAHNKVMVIDGALVLTGSFNWTKAAQESNAENMVVLPSREAANAYAANWGKRLATARPYVRKSER